MHSRRESVQALIVALSFALAPTAARAADTCTGADLSGANTMPVSLPSNVNLLGNDFAPGGVNCANAGGDDHVVCFVPTASCSIIAQCAPNNFDASISMYSVPTCGAITGSTACVASAQGSGPAVNQALTGGVRYCFVCDSTETGSTDESLLLFVNVTAGDCGALPVALQTFSVQ